VRETEQVHRVRHIKVYTRTGDKGKSSLYNGKRREKSDAIFSALGDTDELNAHLGVAREFCTTDVVGEALPARLVEIQSRLLDIGSVIATPLNSSTEEQLGRVQFDDAHVDALESWIDEMDAELPALRNFVLPVRDESSKTLPHACIYFHFTVRRSS
jgi:ATP:cob(I)alamin adenosyltransferase